LHKHPILKSYIKRCLHHAITLHDVHELQIVTYIIKDNYFYKDSQDYFYMLNRGSKLWDALNGRGGMVLVKENIIVEKKI